MKNVLIFGSTGSIGKSGLTVIAKYPEQFKVLGLCAYRDIRSLKKQIDEFNPRYVCVADTQAAKDLAGSLKRGVILLTGWQGLLEFSAIDCDLSLMAIAGISCLQPLIINISHAKRIALANKESIVTAANIIFDLARKHKTEIVPVDSEINALYQLHQLPQKIFQRLYLTASGGALRALNSSEVELADAKTVLAHPTWSMGKRVTVDSATLVNKGFEVIETHYFFNMPYEDIEIVIHPESMMHAMVEYQDFSMFACMYPPDMKIPIAYALGFPQRLIVGQRFNFKKPFSFSFEPVDYRRYPLLKIILAAAKREDNGLVVLNACDEVVIEQFLAGNLVFRDMTAIMRWMFETYTKKKIISLNDVIYWDAWARKKTGQYIKKHW